MHFAALRWIDPALLTIVVLNKPLSVSILFRRSNDIHIGRFKVHRLIDPYSFRLHVAESVNFLAQLLLVLLHFIWPLGFVIGMRENTVHSFMRAKMNQTHIKHWVTSSGSHLGLISLESR
jgi:hypothetical protein